MRRRLAAVLIPFLFALGCSGFNAPPNFDSQDTLAFHVNQVTLTLDTLADITINAEKQGMISHADKLAVLKAESIANKASKDLLLAVQAGAAQADAKAKAIAIIREVLKDVGPQLSPHAQEVVGPIIVTINVVLDALK